MTFECTQTISSCYFMIWFCHRISIIPLNSLGFWKSLINAMIFLIAWLLKSRNVSFYDCYETEIVIITMLCLHIADAMGIICTTKSRITRAKSFSHPQPQIHPSRYLNCSALCRTESRLSIRLNHVARVLLSDLFFDAFFLRSYLMKTDVPPFVKRCAYAVCNGSSWLDYDVVSDRLT